MQVRFLRAARVEYVAEIAFYSEAREGLGLRFASAVEAAVARALAFPLAGVPSPANTRRVIVKGFPFSVFYRIESKGIVIFAVAHHARSAGYWTGRQG